MSELTDALELADRHGLARLMPEVQKIIMDAARRVADLDYEAANRMFDAILDNLAIPHDNWVIDVEVVVDAALGIDPPEET